MQAASILPGQRHLLAPLRPELQSSFLATRVALRQVFRAGRCFPHVVQQFRQPVPRTVSLSMFPSKMLYGVEDLLRHGYEIH